MKISLNDSPATMPLRFFQSLQQKDYALAWNTLSTRSQQLIVKLLANSWKAQTPEQIANDFLRGQGTARTYWDHFRETVQIQDWLTQSYRPFGISGDEVIVKATPSNVTMMVFREGQSWKFGYMETFGIQS